MAGRGSKPGERRGGRQAGTPNKATAQVKELAQAHGPAVIARLAVLAGVTDKSGSLNEATQLGAMKELLDRGYGKPAQTLASDRDNPLFPKITVLFGDHDDSEEAG